MRNKKSLDAVLEVLFDEFEELDPMELQVHTGLSDQTHCLMSSIHSIGVSGYKAPCACLPTACQRAS
jgi:hypothetical protein